MKKTLTINLSGIVFNIDEDAYEVLQQYLNKLEFQFTGEDGKEIMSDIETRLAELFGDATKHDNKRVVTITHVNCAIEQLGTAEEIGCNENRYDKCDDNEKKESRKQYRKFYRDGENKILGGVAAGVAAYCGFDMTLVRLIFVVLAITILGWLIPIYLLVWLIAPEAKTTAQKLEMQGIEPSIENIKEYLNSEKFKESAGRIGSKLGEVVKWLFRIVAIIVGVFFIVIGAFVIGALIIALIGLIVGGAALGSVIGEFMPMGIGNGMIGIFVVASLIACLIPIISIIMRTVRLIRNDTTPRKKGWGWFWFVIWLVSVIVALNALVLNMPDVVRVIQYFDDNDLTLFVDDDTITEERLRGEMFHSIEIKNALNVVLVKDSCCYVAVKNSAMGLRNIKTEIENGELKISYVTPIEQISRNQRVEVHYCSEVRKIDVGSASVVSTEDKILETKNLELDFESATVVNIGVKCERLDIEAESAAVVNIWGECEYLEGDLASASVVNLKDLTTQEARINASESTMIDTPKKN